MGELLRLFYPESFETKNIYQHPKFEDQFKDILEKSGYKQTFIRLFRTRVKHLDERMKKCILKKDWFEILTGTNGLHSIIIKGELNIRIVFIFTQYMGSDIALLLTPFQEKDNKKKNSKTSYSKAIATANKWIEEVKDIISI